MPITACCVLTLQESAGSTAGSLGLSASIILHISHIMKKEQSERSSSIYFLRHPSLSTPFTSLWQGSPTCSLPLEADMQCGANILSQLTNWSDPLPWAMILSLSPASDPTLAVPRGSHPAACQLPAPLQKPPVENPLLPRLPAAIRGAGCTEIWARETWGTLEVMVHLCISQHYLFSVRRAKLHMDSAQPSALAPCCSLDAPALLCHVS